MIKIYGKNVVREAISSNRRIEKLMVTSTFYAKEKRIIEEAKKKNITIEIVEKNVLEPLGNHQGVSALAEDYKYYSLDECLNGEKQYFLMLDGIVDPHNLGAMIRSCDASGIDGIIIPKNRSVSLNATVAKVSTGAIEHVKIIEVNNLVRTMENLKKKGFWIVGTDMVADKDYTELSVDTSLVIIIGNEGEGMGRLVREKCDYTVSIPIIGSVNSLNASVTAALLMYEILRKKKSIEKLNN